MPDKRAVAMLGGTFNPIHNAHLYMAEAVKAALGLEEVLLVVDRDPPHKAIESGITAEERFAMAALAVEGRPGITASDMELHRAGKSYTVDTLRALRAARPDAQLILIVGGDMLADLPTWREATEIAKLARVVCVPRPNQAGGEAAAAERARELLGASVRILPDAAPPVSSTAIRARVAAGQPILTMVPAPVLRRIAEEGYYLPDPLREILARLRAALSAHRYQHTIGVVETAALLAERHGVDAEQARLAALLHDCGRAIDRGALTHAEVSARLAEEAYGVADAAILRAIRLHTTGGEDMTPLDQLLYLADMIEPGRDYPAVYGLRYLAWRDLKAATILGMEQTLRYLKSRGEEPDPRTLAALSALRGPSWVNRPAGERQPVPRLRPWPTRYRAEIGADGKTHYRIERRDAAEDAS